MVGKKLLVITEFSMDGYSFLARLASRHDKIIWIASNPCIPYKMLKTLSYAGELKLFGFRKDCGRFVNPTNLNDICAVFKSEQNIEDACVVLSCISELLMLHRIEKVYCFLLGLINRTESLLGMLIEDAQDKRYELLISTLFDAVFRLKKEFAINDWEMVLTHQKINCNNYY